MFLLIRYPVGIIVEAVALAMGKSRMRVAAAGFSDTIELRRTGSQWFAGSRQPVEFEFLLSHVCEGGRVSVGKPARVGRLAGSAGSHY